MSWSAFDNNQAARSWSQALGLQGAHAKGAPNGSAFLSLQLLPGNESLPLTGLIAEFAADLTLKIIGQVAAVGLKKLTDFAVDAALT